MASTDPTVPPDGDPYIPAATALCEAGRHARCRGEVLSLRAPVGTRCRCTCHRRPLPDAFADQVAAFPPCDADGGEAA